MSRSNLPVVSLLALLSACGDEVSSSAQGTTGATSATSGAGGAGAAGSASSGASTASGFGGGAPAAVWCEAVRDPFCEAMFACCTDPGTLDSYGSTVRGCKALFAQCEANLTRDIGAVLDSGSSVLDEAALGACVAKLEGLSTGGAACVEPPQWIYFLECISAFSGQVAPDQPCVTTPDDISFVECSHGLCQGGSCVGFKKEGEACAPGGKDFCDYTVGLWCSSDGMTCAPRGDLGAPCTPGAAGDPVIECKSLTCGSDSKCAAPTAEALCSDAN